jgi:hypothetical protein
VTAFACDASAAAKKNETAGQAASLVMFDPAPSISSERNGNCRHSDRMP